ncbi:hypothetical protein EVA_03945 [gut metagenome]|uniref:Uncharacterized protein n=1 Tax=gut metagenome TaxID=749906 RepID=J9D5F1_9ZZZZ
MGKDGSFGPFFRLFPSVWAGFCLFPVPDEAKKESSSPLEDS